MSILPVVLFASVALLVSGVPPVAGQVGALAEFFKTLMNMFQSHPLGNWPLANLTAQNLLLTNFVTTMNTAVGQILYLVSGTFNTPLSPAQLTCIANVTSSAFNTIKTVVVPQFFAAINPPPLPSDIFNSSFSKFANISSTFNSIVTSTQSNVTQCVKP